MAYYIICFSLSAAKISTSETSLLGSQPQYMRKLLSIVKSKVQTSCVDVTIKFTLSALWNLTGEFFHSKHIGDLRDSGCCVGGVVGCCPYCNEMSKCALNMCVAVSSEFLPDFIWQKY